MSPAARLRGASTLCVGQTARGESGGFNLSLFAYLMKGRIMYLTFDCLIRIIYRKRIQETSHPWQPERSYPLS